MGCPIFTTCSSREIDDSSGATRTSRTSCEAVNVIHFSEMSGEGRGTAVKRGKLICEKQEKILHKMVVVFTVQSLSLYKYPVFELPFLGLYLKSSKYLKMGKFGLVGAICQLKQF